MEITARAVSSSFVTRLRQLGTVAAILLLIIALYRMVERHGIDGLVGRKMATVLIVLGVVAMLIGVSPLVGLVAATGGLLQHVRLSAHKWQATSATV